MDELFPLRDPEAVLFTFAILLLLLCTSNLGLRSKTDSFLNVNFLGKVMASSWPLKKEVSSWPLGWQGKGSV